MPIDGRQIGAESLQIRLYIELALSLSHIDKTHRVSAQQREHCRLVRIGIDLGYGIEPVADHIVVARLLKPVDAPLHLVASPPQQGREAGERRDPSEVRVLVGACRLDEYGIAGD